MFIIDQLPPASDNKALIHEQRISCGSRNGFVSCQERSRVRKTCGFSYSEFYL
jgi:hypothetical protein